MISWKVGSWRIGSWKFGSWGERAAYGVYKEEDRITLNEIITAEDEAILQILITTLPVILEQEWQS